MEVIPITKKPLHELTQCERCGNMRNGLCSKLTPAAQKYNPHKKWRKYRWFKCNNYVPKAAASK